ncbi:N6-adenosine-specific RNA methylase IME4/ParB-like chromosome segregation protein Spo0J [Rhizobium leguminosarum]|uniref:MT-A70 family methyltransferase n=1 Tax=Rhizobium leguminosarum TaxID=384 RepID=UPI00160FF132|nr:MT-A70 family methyltransferase [Rhizobium leguminosarum]MBB4590188.1 N6-adenosine-specific RNA methylase IME4/ParB-like chromosome segregation protein Spo0J [Rhizobium leguminosarum]
MSDHPVIVGQDIASRMLETAERNGFVIDTTVSERKACIRLNGKGLLRRDKKLASKWYPTAEAVQPAAPAAVHAPDGRNAIWRNIASIDIGSRLRPADPAKVEAMKPSFLEIGQKTPITVFGKPEDPRATLSAGLHRLQTAKALGWENVLCFHEDGDALDAELWEIDENLIRAELTAADRALFLSRRKEIYLLKHPETAQGGDRKSKRQDVVLIDAPQTFSVATAVATGRDRRTIERDTSRGERIIESALHRLRGTRLDSGAFLDRLKQVPEERQVLYVEAALAEEKQKAADVKENRRKQQEVRHAVRLVHMAHVTTNGAATAGRVAQKFPIIYADPPWKFDTRSEVTGGDRSAANHYPTMPTMEICALWERIGAPAKNDAVLFLWATNPMLPDGLQVMSAWGFTYVHHWVWDKEIAGNGYWGRDRHELLLIGRRGNPATPIPGSQPHTVHREAKGKHSAKPDFYAETIERLYPDMPRLEMFCRDPRPGWTAWGYEAGTAESEVA